jgi:ABC-type phosphate/phosphonate transport system substrate-binding protein
VKSLFRDVDDSLIPAAVRPMKELMEDQIGLAGDLVPVADADAVASQIKSGKAQFGVFQGVEFAWIHAAFPTLKPLIIAVNRRPFLRAHLVVRANGKIAAPADLKGKVVGLPRKSRLHCVLFLERRCCPEKETPDKFFSKVSAPSSAEDALDEVVDDEAQGAVVDEAAFEDYQKNKPGRASKLKSLDQSESFPCVVVVYQQGDPSYKTLATLRDGLVAAKDSIKAEPLLRKNHITGYEITPSDYEKQLAEIAKAYPAPGGK